MKSEGQNNFAWTNSPGGSWLRIQMRREVISDPHGRYYGIEVSERALVPDNNARLSETRFETWLTQSASQIGSASPQPAASVAAGKQESRKRAG